MKKFISMMAMAVMIGGLSTATFAAEEDGYAGYAPNDGYATTTGDCGTSDCPQTAWKVGGVGEFNAGGFGISQYNGGDGVEGYNFAEKVGGGDVAINLNVTTGLCGGIDCGDGSFSGEANAFESVIVKTGAKDTSPGTTLSIINQAGGVAGATFMGLRY